MAIEIFLPSTHVIICLGCLHYWENLSNMLAHADVWCSKWEGPGDIPDDPQRECYVAVGKPVRL